MPKTTFKIWRGDAQGGEFREYEAEISEGLLCLADLGLHAMTVGPFAEWRAMRHRVIADPMSGLAHSARCLLPSLLEQSLADDKEDRS